MALAQPMKFAFGTTFDVAPEDARGGTDIVDRRTLEAAKAEAYAQGVRVGRDEEQKATVRQEADALTALGRALGQAASQAAEAHAGASRNAAPLALAIARKLTAALIARAPAGELEALIGRCLHDMAGEPRIVVRLAPAMFDLLGPRMDRLSAAAGYGGQVVVIGDGAILGTDCRVEWADGGVVRDEAAAWHAIEDFADRIIGPRPTPLPPVGPAEQETP